MVPGTKEFSHSELPFSGAADVYLMMHSSSKYASHTQACLLSTMQDNEAQASSEESQIEQSHSNALFETAVNTESTGILKLRYDELLRTTQASRSEQCTRKCLMWSSITVGVEASMEGQDVLESRASSAASSSGLSTLRSSIASGLTQFCSAMGNNVLSKSTKLFAMSSNRLPVDNAVTNGGAQIAAAENQGGQAIMRASCPIDRIVSTHQVRSCPGSTALAHVVLPSTMAARNLQLSMAVRHMRGLTLISAALQNVMLLAFISRQ